MADLRGLGCKAAEGLTKLDCHDEAIALLSQLESHLPRAIRPRQLRALALARRAVRTNDASDLKLAQEILAELYAAGERDPETLGIYGRTWMDRHERDGDELALQRSRDLYAEAFDGAQDDFYTAINAAAKSVFLDTPEDLEKAASYAARVLEITGTEAAPRQLLENRNYCRGPADPRRLRRGGQDVQARGGHGAGRGRLPPIHLGPGAATTGEVECDRCQAGAHRSSLRPFVHDSVINSAASVDSIRSGGQRTESWGAHRHHLNVSPNSHRLCSGRQG
jgi:hypothetical protein